MKRFEEVVLKHINEVNWGNIKNAAKTAGGHALDIATGGISTAVTDTIDAARGKDTGSQVDQLQSQVNQQAQATVDQAKQEAQIDSQHSDRIQQAQTATDQLNQTQETEIDSNTQQIAGMNQRVSKVEQLIQQIQQSLNRPA